MCDRCCVFFFKQKTAYEMRISDWSSDVCSSDLAVMIGKAMIEIPPKFEAQTPVHPGVKDRNHYRKAEGLAEDVRYYGQWIRDKALERIGNIYQIGRAACRERVCQ